MTDDTTHRDTWNLLCQLAGRKDFLYVADCKLATIENMNYIAKEHGRFVSVLPRTRSEDGDFRKQVRQAKVVWQDLWNKTDEEGQVLDQFSVCATPEVTPEGYRLWWFHSTRKAGLDLAVRKSAGSSGPNKSCAAGKRSFARHAPATVNRPRSKRLSTRLSRSAT